MVRPLIRELLAYKALARSCYPGALQSWTYGVNCMIFFFSGPLRAWAELCLSRSLKVRFQKPFVKIRWENISFLHQLPGAIESISKYCSLDEVPNMWLKLHSKTINILQIPTWVWIQMLLLVRQSCGMPISVSDLAQVLRVDSNSLENDLRIHFFPLKQCCKWWPESQIHIQLSIALRRHHWQGENFTWL